jgi:LCP family protein required for cell wall assembly
VPKDAARPRRTWPQRGVLVFNSLVIVGALAAAGLVYTANDTLSDTRRVVIHDAADTSAPTTVSDEPVLPGQTTTTIDVSGDVAAKNYLIVGSDSRACIDPGSPYAGAFLTEGNDIGDRSDTIMVLRVDPDESQAAILSFPRDLWVRIGSSNRKARINSAFDKEDPSRLVETIEQNFEIPVDHYIEVDFCAFKYLVDAVGGVKIPFEFPTRDRYTGLNVPEPGCFTMSGDAALAYVRSRHYQYEEDGRWKEDGSSDRGRIRRQQDFIKRMLRKAIDRGATRPDVAKRLIDTALDHVRIDQSLTVNDMLRVSARLRSFDPEAVRTYRMDGNGTNIGGAAVIVPDLDDPATQDVLRVFRGEATVADAPPADTAATDAPGTDEGSSTSEAGGTTTATSTTEAAVTDGTGPTTTAGPSVLIEDNGVGIFPPDDPTCR